MSLLAILHKSAAACKDNLSKPDEAVRLSKGMASGVIITLSVTTAFFSCRQNNLLSAHSDDTEVETCLCRISDDKVLEGGL